MENKKGAIGKLSVSFVSTIIIFLLLLVFILISGFVKDYINAREEASFRDEVNLGVEGVDEYMEKYTRLLTDRERDYSGGDMIEQESNWGFFNVNRARP